MGFLDLPPEMRDRIYFFATQSDYPIHLGSNTEPDDNHPQSDSALKTYIALNLTCHHIGREVAELFWAKNHFVINRFGFSSKTLSANIFYWKNTGNHQRLHEIVPYDPRENQFQIQHHITALRYIRRLKIYLGVLRVTCPSGFRSSWMHLAIKLEKEIKTHGRFRAHLSIISDNNDCAIHGNRCAGIQSTDEATVRQIQEVTAPWIQRINTLIGGCVELYPELMEKVILESFDMGDRIWRW